PPDHRRPTATDPNTLSESVISQSRDPAPHRLHARRRRGRWLLFPSSSDSADAQRRAVGGDLRAARVAHEHAVVATAYVHDAAVGGAARVAVAQNGARDGDAAWAFHAQDADFHAV